MKRRLKQVRVFSPATVANLACGFDIMGLAIDEPGDEVTLIPNDIGTLRILKITGDRGLLSRDPEKNTVTVSIAALLKEAGLQQGFDILLKKQMPLGSGLGSSAASSAAGAFAANEALGRPFSREDLVRFAMEGERVACGTAHPDNVAPCILGGIVLCHQSGHFVKLPVPQGMHVIVINPHVELLTRISRSVLPASIPLRTAVSQWANTAALTASLYEGDYQLMKEAMQDHVAEPARGKLIKGFSSVKEAALDAGAIACSISGSGPSVFAISRGKSSAVMIAAAMKAAFRRNKVNSTVYISKVNRTGTRILR